MRFGPIDVAFDGAVLRPRPWTLAQSEWAAALSATAEPGPILELCCGAGQIGIAAAVLSNRSAILIDDDEAARRWATQNAARADVVATVAGEALPDLGAPLVLADPPYVPSDAIAEFDDPPHAIDGGADGLDGLRWCVRVTASILFPGAPLLLQLRGLAQAAALDGELPGLAASLTIEAVRVYGPDRAVALLRADP